MRKLTQYAVIYKRRLKKRHTVFCRHIQITLLYTYYVYRRVILEIQEIKQIAAFLPCYEKGRGQGIKIYYRNGETGFLHLAMRTFLAKTAGLFAVSLRESRKRYGLLLDRKNLVPLVLTPYLLYVPLKARIPAVPGDPAYGYFRLRSIIEINREPQPCTVA